jgi:hypothetical protein
MGAQNSLTITDTALGVHSRGPHRHRRHHPRAARRLEARQALVGSPLTHGSAHKVLGLILTAAATLLFLFNLRRAGERAGRATERHYATEKNAAARHPLDRDALADRLRDGRF